MMSKDKKSMNTIKLCVYFHTSQSGIKLEPKVAFKAGWISMPTNHTHGIRTSDVGQEYFGMTQGTVSDAMARCLKKSGIKFIEYGKEGDYRKFQEAKTKEDFYDKNFKV
jgi:hypothetical protein